MTEIATIPFADLKAVDEINARAATKEGLDELAASIAARGLIQPLAVRPADGGKYEVIDGRRRYMAIAKLVKAKKWKKSDTVPVLVRNEDDAGALETSLAANTIRLPMHPVDQHSVFARLVEQGRNVDEIAASFGITKRTVQQHMALGKLAPVIRDAWKKGKIDTKAAQAFADHSGHEVQSALYERLKKEGDWGLREDRVRQELNRNREPVTCREMAFVGVDAYLAAGGTLTESLFVEQSYVDDMPLLAKLLRDKIEWECARLRAEGWVWAELEGDLPQRWPDGWRQWEEIDENRTEEDAPEFTAEEKARSGVVVDAGWDGEFSYFWGLIRPDGAETTVADDDDQVDIEEAIGNAAAPSARVEIDDEESEDGAEHTGDRKISQLLAQTLSEVLTLASTKALAEDPHLALRAAVAALAPGGCPSKPVKLHSNGWRANTMPMDGAKPFAELLERTAGESTETLLRALAFDVSRALDMRTFSGGPRSAAVDALIAALPANAYLAAARAEFNPTDYFKRATKAVAIAALEEMEEAGAIGSLSQDLADAKKAELAEMASTSAKACGWLPPELRHPAYALQVSETEEAA